MMDHAADMPVWVALVVSFFLVMGATLTLIGAIGFSRFNSFYERIHAPTLGTSWGTGGIVLASMIFFSVEQSRLVVHEILIGIFITVTTPVTLMLLARAALYRDRAERSEGVPFPETMGPPPRPEPDTGSVPSS